MNKLRPNPMKKVLLISSLLLAACATSTSEPSSNNTAYNYHLNQQVLQQKPIKRVYLANVPTGRPALYHLRGSAIEVRSMVKDYLQKNGYTVLPELAFNNAWQQAERNIGEAFDPATGRVNVERWQQLLLATHQQLAASQYDAVVFVDVVEHKALHSFAEKHYAEWFGVKRRPKIIGPGNAINANFDWSQPVKVASVKITIINNTPELVFESYGGLDVTQGIDPRRTRQSYSRVKRMLNNEGHLKEGVEQAFYPFISKP